MWKNISKMIKSMVTNKKRKSEDSDDDDDDDRDENDDTNVIALENGDANRVTEMVECDDGNLISKNIHDAFVRDNITFKDRLLMICAQTQVIGMNTIIPKVVRNTMKGKWMGTYSDVYRYDSQFGKIILKISLVNRRGKNGVILQDMESMISDIVNMKRLSDLRYPSLNEAQYYCDNFVNVRRLSFVWNSNGDYNKTEYRSERKKRKYWEYIVSELEYGGNELIVMSTLSPDSGLSIASQVIMSMAVAEESMQFEHRDLHLSNILIDKTEQKFMEYRIRDLKCEVQTHHLKVTIIDTTFSRTTLLNRKLYNDLSNLNLDDYDDVKLRNVYKSQKSITGDHWNEYYPKTNVFWTHHVIEEIIERVDKWFNEHKSPDYGLLKKYQLLCLWMSQIKQCDSVYGFAKQFLLKSE